MADNGNNNMPPPPQPPPPQHQELQGGEEQVRPSRQRRIDELDALRDVRRLLNYQLLDSRVDP